eukprot:5852902-Pleurochrysis_carterae.AAC.5
MRASGHSGREASMDGTLRGDANPEVKLRDMMTGPRKSQMHPRAAWTKQVCPRTKGCGRARLSGESRMVVRSWSSVSSHACSLGEGRGSVSGGAVRGLKGCWSSSAGEERSGTGESSNASSRTRSSRSHAPTLSTRERR